MASPRDWFLGSTLRTAVLMGGLSGSVAVIQAVVTGQGPLGVGLGVIGGGLLGVVMGRSGQRMTSDLAGLTPEQRSEVGRAVRLGEAPRDPSLATATIERARRVQASNARRWPYLMLGGFTVLAIALALDDVVEGSVPARAIVLLIFWLLLPPLLWLSARRLSTRAASAEAATRRLAGTPPPD